jgi:hypothetical protein
MRDPNGILIGQGGTPAADDTWPVGAECVMESEILGEDGEPLLIEDRIAEVVSRNVDCWEWDVMYSDGSRGAIQWGERDTTGSPLGMPTTNGLRVMKARKRRLVAQLKVKTRMGYVVHLHLPIPDARGKDEQHPTHKLVT